MKSNIFQLGSIFPEISGSALCLVSENKFDELELESLKDDVLGYIKKHKAVDIPTLLKEFNVELDELLMVVKDLKNEGRLRELSSE